LQGFHTQNTLALETFSYTKYLNFAPGLERFSYRVHKNLIELTYVDFAKLIQIGGETPAMERIAEGTAKIPSPAITPEATAI